MLEVQEALTGILALLALHFLLIWYYARGLVGIIEELAFPSDDPIMTSTLTDDEVFEYPEMSTDEEVSAYAEANNVDIATAILETNPEVFVFEETPEEEPAEDEELLKEMAVMSDEEWDEMEARAKKETSSSILYEVGDYTPSGEATLRKIKGMRKDDVIGICEIHGLDTEGTKAQLIERIKENAA